MDQNLRTRDDEASLRTRRIPMQDSEQPAHSETDMLRAIVRASLDPLIVIDDHGTILLASDSVERLFDWRPEELVGQNVRVLMPEPHHSAHDGYLDNFRRTGKTNIIGRTREFEVRRRNGSPFLADLSVNRAQLPNGKPVFIGVFRDVTARRRAEMLVRDSEARFHAIFDSTLHFLGLLSPDGTILEINRTAVEATGVPVGEVLGKRFWEGPWWAPMPDGEAVVRASVERAARGETVLGELLVGTRTGQVLDVTFSIKPIRDPEGRVVLLLPEGRDVTELKRAQKAETQMLRALAQVGESAAVLVHEIKNPITAVNVALRAVADQLGTEHKVVLEDLASRMQRLQELMKGTLSFAKPVKLQPTCVPAKNYIDGCVSRLRLHIVKAGADVAVEAADESLRLEVDVALFEEVLANLVINAIDAQPHGARIKIRVEQEGTNVALHVDDNGPGIPPAKRDDVFRPFVSTKEQGTGLGLPICRKIVEEHGGSIEIGTSPLGGARFTIRLRPNLAKP